MSDALIFRCSSCGGYNRVPAARAQQGPTCGRCKAKLDTAAHPLNVSDAELSQLIAGSPLPVLVDFWAPWCGPCRMVAPELERLARDHAGRLIVAKVNTDQHQQTAASLNVQAIPTLAVYKGGRLLKKEAGALTGRTLDAFVAPAL